MNAGIMEDWNIGILGKGEKQEEWNNDSLVKSLRKGLCERSEAISPLVK